MIDLDYTDSWSSTKATNTNIRWVVDYADTTTLGCQSTSNIPGIMNYYGTNTAVSIEWDTGYYKRKTRYNVNITGTGTTRAVFATCHVSPIDRFRQILQDRQAPYIIGTRKSLKPIEQSINPREFRARETLLRVLGEEKFKRFIRDGFVSVRAKSGLIYQIFPGHGITNVYQNGEHIERLCVVLTGDFPPTDSLIMRYLLILNDERDFRKHAVRYTIFKDRRPERKIVEFEPLTDIWNRLRPKKSLAA